METEYWIYVEGCCQRPMMDEKDLNDKKLQNEIDKLKADRQ